MYFSQTPTCMIRCQGCCMHECSKYGLVFLHKGSGNGLAWGICLELSYRTEEASFWSLLTVVLRPSNPPNTENNNSLFVLWKQFIS